MEEQLEAVTCYRQLAPVNRKPPPSVDGVWNLLVILVTFCNFSLLPLTLVEYHQLMSPATTSKQKWIFAPFLFLSKLDLYGHNCSGEWVIGYIMYTKSLSDNFVVRKVVHCFMSWRDFRKDLPFEIFTTDRWFEYIWILCTELATFFQRLIC